MRFIALIGLPCHAVVLLHTDDPSVNTTEPTDKFQDSGWKFQGDWGRFLGTAIAKNLFITAAHVGGAPGDFFLYQGEPYESIAQFTHPTADLQIVKVADEFPSYARLYTDLKETGANAVYFGRGARRGAPVTNALDDTPRGWRWGASEAWRRWGVNRIEEALETTTDRGPQWALRAEFNLDGVPFECHLSDGDSGGGLFIQSRGAWRLAGVNVGVSGPYKTTEKGVPFNAALFSESGFWVPTAKDEWSPSDVGSDLQPGSLFSMRLSKYQDWIANLTDIHDLIHHRVALLASERPNGPFSELVSTATPADAGVIEVPTPSAQRFYVLKSRRRARFEQVTTTRDSIQFRFAFVDIGPEKSSPPLEFETMAQSSDPNANNGAP